MLKIFFDIKKTVAILVIFCGIVMPNVVFANDLGLGVLAENHGEFFVVDGHYYRNALEYHLKTVSPKKITASFSQIVDFKPIISFGLDHIADYDALDQQLLAKFSDKNKPYAVRLEGSFDAVTVRGLSATQHTLTLKEVKGVAVGFWFPKKGLHLHFITENHKTGGHVLSLKIDQAAAQIQPII